MVSQEIEQPLTVSPEEAAEIAEEVQEIIEAGDEHSAWERVRHLHPADIGIIVASLPRTSRDAIVRVMSPRNRRLDSKADESHRSRSIGDTSGLPDALFDARPDPPAGSVGNVAAPPSPAG